MPDVNYLAVVVAGVAGFFVGGLWYSKAMFCDLWCREAKVQMPAPGEKPARHPAAVFAISIALALVAAYLLAVILGPAPGIERGVKWGAAVGAGFAATSFGINYAFAQRSFKLWLIDAGYHTVQLAVTGVILGLWK